MRWPKPCQPTTGSDVRLASQGVTTRGPEGAVTHGQARRGASSSPDGNHQRAAVFAMTPRAFRPGLDGDPERIAFRGKARGEACSYAVSAGLRPRFFVLESTPWPKKPSSGSTFEPAHRQLVRVTFAGGRRIDARYNRVSRRFWLRFGPGDYMEATEDPVAWEQMLPEPREGACQHRARGRDAPAAERPQPPNRRADLPHGAPSGRRMARSLRDGMRV